MALQKLTLESIKDVDMGRGSIAFKQELATAVADINDRPGVKKARKVAIVVTLTPEIKANEAGVSKLEGISTEFEFHTSLPRRKSPPIRMKASHDGSLLFNTLSPGDPDQGTLDDLHSQPKQENQSVQGAVNPGMDDQDDVILGKVGT